jgi:hypothetical protein
LLSDAMDHHPCHRSALPRRPKSAIRYVGEFHIRVGSLSHPGQTAGSNAAEEPVDAGGRTHGIRHQADARRGHQRWPERQLYEVQLTSGCGWAALLLRRLLPCRANWRYRPKPAIGVAPKQPDVQPLIFLFRFYEAAVRDLTHPSRSRARRSEHDDPLQTGCCHCALSAQRPLRRHRSLGRSRSERPVRL